MAGQEPLLDLLQVPVAHSDLPLVQPVADAPGHRNGPTGCPATTRRIDGDAGDKYIADADGYACMVGPTETGEGLCPIRPTPWTADSTYPCGRRGTHPVCPVKVCSQRTITVGPETGAKTWQALKYGGPEWQKIYFRLQNSVEGCNGYAKNALTEASQSAGSRRITEQSILLALHVAHANRRKNKK